MAYNQGKNPFSKNPLNFNSPLNSFDSLVGKLMNQGKSKEAATKIAGKVANMKMKGAGSGPTAAQKARAKGSAAKMEDLSGDGKITKKDVLIGRGVIEKDGSPAKAHDKKLKALEKRIKRVRQSKEGSEGQGGIDYELLAQLEDQKKKLIESHGKEAKDGNAKPSPASMKSPMKAGKMSGKSIAKPDSGDPEIKTEELDEVVVNAPKNRSRESIKSRKADAKRKGEKSKREIRLEKTKDKALAAKKATVDAKDKDSQKLARAKANRLAKRVARQEGRAERRKARRSKKMFRENKEQAITKSRRLQKEKRDQGASALSMKSPVKSKHDPKDPSLNRRPGGKRNPYTNSPMGDLSGKKVYGPATAAISAGKKIVKKGKKVAKKAVKAAKAFSKDLQKRGT